jgi:predicted esterase
VKTALTVLGVALSPFVLVAAALLASTPLSWSGTAYVLGAATLTAGLALAKKRAGPWLRWAALALVTVTAGARLSTGARGEAVTMVTVDGHASTSSARLLARLVDEEDVALSGARALEATGLWRDPDTRGLVPVMRAAYGEMRAAEGDVPSPVLTTYVGAQSPRGFDMVIAAPAGPASDTAVLFLHGFAGNFTLPCWRFARPLVARGVTVGCPSTTYEGHFWTADGAAIVTQAREALVARGAKRVVLAGLSNGAISASLLAPRSKGAFSALVLVSGVAGDAPCSGLPTLVVHGRRDAMTSPALARSYASRCGGRYVDLDAGHFAMLVRATEVDAALVAFVDPGRRVVSRAAGPSPTRRSRGRARVRYA